MNEYLRSFDFGRAFTTGAMTTGGLYIYQTFIDGLLWRSLGGASYQLGLVIGILLFAAGVLYFFKGKNISVLDSVSLGVVVCACLMVALWIER